MANISLLFLRLLLGSVFIFSSIVKQIYINEFINSLNSYGFIPPSIVNLLAPAICVLELLIGIMIFFDIYGKIALRACLLMMLLFTSFVLWSIIENKNWTCNCFGSIMEQEINYSTLARNIILLSLIILSLFTEKHKRIFTYESIKYKPAVGFFILFILLIPALHHKISPSPSVLKEGDEIKLGLTTWDGNKINIEKRIQPYAILFLISVDDCSSCLDEAYFWEKLKNEFKNSITGIVVFHANNLAILRAFVKHKDIQYPVIFDKNKSIITSLHAKTPTKILLDKSNRIINITRMLGSELVFENYLSFLRKIVNNHSQL